MKKTRALFLLAYSPTGVGWPRGGGTLLARFGGGPGGRRSASHSWDGLSPCLQGNAAYIIQGDITSLEGRILRNNTRSAAEAGSKIKAVVNAVSLRQT